MLPTLARLLRANGLHSQLSPKKKVRCHHYSALCTHFVQLVFPPSVPACDGKTNTDIFRKSVMLISILFSSEDVRPSDYVVISSLVCFFK